MFFITFFIVDYTGLLYFYANGKKIEHISKIEETKEKCSSDAIALSSLNEMMEDVINRKTIFQRFASLFEDSKSTTIRIVQEIEQKGNYSDPHLV